MCFLPKAVSRVQPADYSFTLPVATPELTIPLLWHPRLDADPVHRWVRGHIREICAIAD